MRGDLIVFIANKPIEENDATVTENLILVSPG
jgi:hypothetical protein